MVSTSLPYVRTQFWGYFFPLGRTSTKKDSAPLIATNTLRFDKENFFNKLRKLNQRYDLIAKNSIKFILHSEGYTLILVA